MKQSSGAETPTTGYGERSTPKKSGNTVGGTGRKSYSYSYSQRPKKYREYKHLVFEFEGKQFIL